MNGYICKQIMTGGYIDDNGVPVPGTTTWGSDVECKYFANVSNNKGRYEEGEFKQASFEITTEDMDFIAGVIQLKNSKKAIIATKEVLSLEELEDIQRIKLTI